MPNFILVLLSIAVSILSWGLYGPLIRAGQAGMGGDHLRPFVCVGIAYFVLAVVVPVLWIATRGEKGTWSVGGGLWSLLAGALGAAGALGVILAFTNHGNPVYVMPLVFGGAPVVNTFLTMFLGRTYKQAGPLFFAGLILVIAGAASVLYFKPGPPTSATRAPVDVHLASVAMAVALTVLCWGAYGPALHKGQASMAGSRLRPFIAVGVAYFLVAVLAPLALMQAGQPHGAWSFDGALWSLAGGAAGAAGALGIILSFNFGGKPIYVMPLVFGGAPVVNTFTSILSAGDVVQISPMFYAGLIVVIAGAVTVLVFAPKGQPHAAHDKPAAGPGQVKQTA